MKTCNKCKISKELEKFGKDKGKLDGHKYMCKNCHNSTNNSFRKANPETYREANLAYARSTEGKAIQRANNLRRKFWSHLTNEQAVYEYDKLLKSQNNCCALCGIHQALLKTSLAVDHDHDTGLPRGLLCNKCNRFEVGRHNLKSSEQLVKYLQRYKKSA